MHWRSPLGIRTGFRHKAPWSDVRGGTRIPCNIPVTLTSVDGIRWFSEQGVIVLANPQGCAVRVGRSLDVGTAVLFEGWCTQCEHGHCTDRELHRAR
jgi:hypothetical protein